MTQESWTSPGVERTEGRSREPETSNQACQLYTFEDYQSTYTNMININISLSYSFHTSLFSPQPMIFDKGYGNKYLSTPLLLGHYDHRLIFQSNTHYIA